MRRSFIVSLVLAALTIPEARAEQLPIDVLEATPVGSWQLRETTTTDHKGRTQMLVTRTSLVGEEKRDGKLHLWIEMEHQNYKIKKKGARKREGDPMLLKVLVDKTALEGDPANVINNLSGWGVEVIFQKGDEDPMRITNAGSMAQGIMQSMGMKVDYDFSVIGDETISTAAGEFATTKIAGKGSTEVSLFIKTLRVESESEMWLSADMPFAIVQMTDQSTVNGKRSTSQSTVIEFGRSGAKSKITKEPKDLEMPNLNPFGR